MKPLFFAFPGNEDLLLKLVAQQPAERGIADFRQFPDGETYVRIDSELKNRQVVIVCTLHQPDTKFLLLHFFSKIAREMGCAKITLISPYLGYMRQDKIFKVGEGLTSTYFAHLVSSCVDELITIDPHLHRIASLNKIYTIPCRAMQAAVHIARWITQHVPNPLLIGPDSESEQWVSDVAIKAKAPFVVLQKIRTGDKEVRVSVPNVQAYAGVTPVLVDDIISTGKSMMETILHLKKINLSAPVCVGIHAVFAPGAYQELLATGASRVVTCNTIPHESNQIDISDLLQVNGKQI
ncbi:MAG: ribose-phosphate pyrophosphokinase [bacterium]|nr:ribose-phosphate pyrophosphokinase [bacterium]